MSEEEFYSQDLFLWGYSRRWKEAKRMTHRAKPELDGSAYWLAVRLCYLELGGLYKRQVNAAGQPLWEHHPA